MKCRLKNYEVSPPGGFPYIQQKGIYREFPSQPLIESQAQMVLAFRQKNNLPRATFQETLQDIDRFTCHRLGCMSIFCVPLDEQGNVNPMALNQTSPLLVPCRGCGAPLVMS